VLKHKGHTNAGLLASHVWSVAGSDSHPYVSETYAQPFVAYTTTKAWTFAATSYDTYNWTAGRCTAIVNPIRVSKLLKLGRKGIAVLTAATPRKYQRHPYADNIRVSRRSGQDEQSTNCASGRRYRKP
jgi:hypothetical protein